MGAIVGRTEELQILQKVLDSSAPQIVAVYGRRRVGKTFLVRSFFEQKIRLVEITGRKGGSRPEQLAIFLRALNKAFPSALIATPIQNWQQAFDLLATLVENAKERIAVFFDELPWLATPRSGLLEELDHCWNTRLSRIENLKVILCGSAASWMLKNIVNSKGGLYNRLTGLICLNPLSLRETKEYLLARNVVLTNGQLIELYLCIGGVPYYLDWVSSGASPVQILGELAFSPTGVLFKDYDELISSLFEDHKSHIAVLDSLAAQRYGMTIDDLSKATAVSRGASLLTCLDELSAAGFIKGYTPFGNKRKGTYFRIIDEYTTFYKRWIEPLKRSSLTIQRDYWFKESQSAAFYSWAGYNFESIVQKHANQVAKALGISGMALKFSSWRHIGSGESRGAQVDLLIDRADRIVTLCEIKYRAEPLLVDQAFSKTIQQRRTIFQSVTKTTKAVNSVLVVSSSAIKNPLLQTTFAGLVVGDQLFGE